MDNIKRVIHKQTKNVYPLILLSIWDWVSFWQGCFLVGAYSRIIPWETYTQHNLITLLGNSSLSELPDTRGKAIHTGLHIQIYTNNIDIHCSLQPNTNVTSWQSEYMYDMDNNPSRIISILKTYFRNPQHNNQLPIKVFLSQKWGTNTDFIFTCTTVDVIKLPHKTTNNCDFIHYIIIRSRLL